MKLNKYSWLALLPLAFTACQDDMLVENAEQPVEERYTLRASMQGNEEGSRAQIIIGGTSQEGESFYWNENDVFAMYVNGEWGQEHYRFTISDEYSEDTYSKTADFSTEYKLEVGKSFVAFYPDCESENGWRAWEFDWNNSTYKARLDQTFTVENGDVAAAWRKYFNRNMLMHASGRVGIYSTESSVQFQHLCGLIRITFTDSTSTGSTVHAIKLDGSWGSEAFVSRQNGSVTTSGNNDDQLEMTVNHPSGINVPKGEKQDFYLFFLPPGGDNVNPLTKISITCHLDLNLEPMLWDETPATYGEEVFAISGLEAGKCYWFNVTKTDQGLFWTKLHTSSELPAGSMVEETADSYIFKNKVFAQLLVKDARYCGFTMTEEGYAIINKENAHAITDLYLQGGYDFGDTSYQVGSLNRELSCFPNLRELTMVKVGLTSADFSGLKSLVKLDCSLNSLTELDLSQNTELEELVCGRNQLKSLDLSHNTKLKLFRSNAFEGASWIYNNYFSEIDFSNNTALTYIDLDYNCLITRLDLSMLSELEELNVGGLHQLTSLDLSHNPKLRRLSCGDTKNLQSIDFSNNPLLEYLAFETTSKIVDLSLLPNLKKLYYYTDDAIALDFSNCSNLEELCYRSPIITSFDATHMTNLYKLNVSNCKKMTELKLGSHPNMRILECVDNRLTSLDLSGCPNLKQLWCHENELTSLDITMLSNLNKEEWELAVGNHKDKSIEDNEEYYNLVLSLTQAQYETWNAEDSWGKSSSNNHVTLNVVSMDNAGGGIAEGE